MPRARRWLRRAVGALALTCAAAAGSDRAALATYAVRAPGRANGAATGIAAPTRAHGATTARVVAAAHARTRPGGARRIWRVGPLTGWARQAQTLLVLGSAEYGGIEWVKVLLPVRPNGRAGWIPRDNVVLARTGYWIDVRLRPRRLTVYHGGHRLRGFRAVVGAPGTPTPRGLAAIYERSAQADPSGFLGPWALSLTAFSRVLESYGGGPGRVAIHGRGGASLRDPLGSDRSHGCIRIRNRAVAWLARRVPPATPVRIRR
jgi:lipoprotein-anchoring transpeptidase ErfK/SrfK